MLLSSACFIILSRAVYCLLLFIVESHFFYSLMKIYVHNFSAFDFFYYCVCFYSSVLSRVKRAFENHGYSCQIFIFNRCHYFHTHFASNMNFVTGSIEDFPTLLFCEKLAQLPKSFTRRQLLRTCNKI